MRNMSFNTMAFNMRPYVYTDFREGTNKISFFYIQHLAKKQRANKVVFLFTLESIINKKINYHETLNFLYAHFS